MSKGISSEVLLVALFVCCAAFIECSTRCEEGWEHFAGSCYLFVSTSTTQFGARQQCLAANSSLVDIRTHDENQFIASKTLGSGHWIDLRGTPAVWISDATGLPRTWDSFSNWRPGQPNGNSECAVMALWSGTWYILERSCTYPRSSVCKRFPVSSSCGRGWRQHGEFCYLIVPQLKSWDAAQRHCASLSAHLADPQTSGENEFIRGLTATYRGYYLGLRRRPGRWAWNTEAREIDYENWAADVDPGRLDGTERCAEISLGGKWKPSTCNAHRPYICKVTLDMCDRHPYGPCSRTCGEGTKARNAVCRREDVTQFILEVVPCEDSPPCSP